MAGASSVGAMAVAGASSIGVLAALMPVRVRVTGRVGVSVRVRVRCYSNACEGQGHG